MRILCKACDFVFRSYFLFYVGFEQFASGLPNGWDIFRRPVPSCFFEKSSELGHDSVMSDVSGLAGGVGWRGCRGYSVIPTCTHCSGQPSGPNLFQNGLFHFEAAYPGQKLSFLSGPVPSEQVASKCGSLPEGIV